MVSQARCMCMHPFHTHLEFLNSAKSCEYSNVIKYSFKLHFFSFCVLFSFLKNYTFKNYLDLRYVHYYNLCNYYGGRSLVGYSPWGCKESDMTEQLHFTIMCEARQQIT